MRHWIMLGTLGLAVTLTAGCQKSTSTGPGGTTRSGQPAAKKLTVMAAKDHTVKRGDTEKITINRDNFNDPVTIQLSGLPKGVELVDKEAVIASGNSSATITLKAAPDAEMGEHQVTIAAEVPGMEKNTQTFKLTVKDK
jgi:hypothetical protein